jgi:hypothetical protein
LAARRRWLPRLLTGWGSGPLPARRRWGPRLLAGCRRSPLARRWTLLLARGCWDLTRARTLPLPLADRWPRPLPRGWTRWRSLPLNWRCRLRLSGRRPRPLPRRWTRWWSLPLTWRCRLRLSGRRPRPLSGWRWPLPLSRRRSRPRRLSRWLRLSARARPDRLLWGFRLVHHSGTPDWERYQNAELNQTTVNRAASKPPSTGSVHPGSAGSRRASILAAKTP